MRYILEINLTNACNLHCGYCVASAAQSYKASKGSYALVGAVLDYQDVWEWIDRNFKPDNVHTVIITGGEPTILPLWYVLPNKLIANNYNVVILSNGGMLWKTARGLIGKHSFLLTWHSEQMTWDEFAKNADAIKERHLAVGQFVVTPKMIEDKWEICLIEEKFNRIGLPVLLRGAEKVPIHEKGKASFHTSFNDKWYLDRKDKNGNPVNITEAEVCVEDLCILSLRPNGNYGQCHHPLKQDLWGNIYTDNKTANLRPEWRVCRNSKTGSTMCATENTVLTMKRALKSGKDWIFPKLRYDGSNQAE